MESARKLLKATAKAHLDKARKRRGERGAAVAALTGQLVETHAKRPSVPRGSVVAAKTSPPLPEPVVRVPKMPGTPGAGATTKTSDKS